MINFKKTLVCRSGTPGVHFTVRRINFQERAERDMGVIEFLSRYDDLIEEYNRLPKPTTTTNEAGEEVVTPPVDTPAQARRRAQINLESGLLLNAYIKPAAIRAGIVEIHGLTLDGQPMSVEEFLTTADENFINEAFVLCEAAAKLPMAKMLAFEVSDVLPTDKDTTTAETTDQPVAA